MNSVTLNDRPQFVCNRFVFEPFGGAFVLHCCSTMPCWFCGLCNSMESDCFPFSPSVFFLGGGGILGTSFVHFSFIAIK